MSAATVLGDTRTRELENTPVNLDGLPARITGWKDLYATIRLSMDTTVVHVVHWTEVDRTVKRNGGHFFSQAFYQHHNFEAP